MSDPGINSLTQSSPAETKEAIRLPDEEAARKYCRQILPARSNGVDLRVLAVVAAADKLWSRDENVIRYGFAKDYPGTDAQQKKVAEALKEWEKYGAFDFQQFAAGSAAAAVPDVVVAFDPSPSQGSWSLTGTESLSRRDEDATMNLGWVDAQPELTRGERAVILHEFGHVLGMLHEHQSPAGGGVPIKNIDAAMAYYRQAEGWSEDMIREKVINTYNTNDVSSFSQVDRQSIMHYPMPAAVTGLDHDIDYNYDLSAMDKSYMAIMYPRASPHPEASEWTLQYALDKAGITGQDPTLAQQIFDKARVNSATHRIDMQDVKAIRGMFTDFCHKNHLPNQPHTG